MKRNMTWAIWGISAFLVLSGCNARECELNARLRAKLEEMNRISETQFMNDTYRDVERIEREAYFGNQKNQFARAEYLSLIEAYNRANASLKYAIEASKNDLFVKDSVLQAARRWESYREGLAKRFEQQKRYNPILQSKNAFEDSLKLLDQRLDGANADAVASELEILRSGILTEAKDMATFLNYIAIPGCNLGVFDAFDTLSLLQIAQSNPTVAGENAWISFGITDGRFNQITPEYSGTGSFDPIQRNGFNTMHLKTSESMIPPGQNEAEVPYKVICKVPKADGTLHSLYAQGKIKVRRACDSPLRVPDGAQ